MRIGIIGLLALLSINSFGQSEADQDWKSKDFNTDGIPGISLDAAYKQFVDGKTGEEIVVAVIDSGVEVDHDDLKDKIWINEDEIPDNGIDDDNNGYVDDVHGWNFIGGPGGDVEFDNLEFTRIYKKLKDRFEGKDKASISSEDKEDFARYLKMSEQFDARLGSAEENLKEFKAIKQVFRMSKKTMKEVLNGDEYTVENLEALPKGDERFEALRGLAIEDLKNDVSKDIDEAIDHFKNQTKYSYNLKLDTREMVGDDYDDLSVTNYGNNHYEGPRARHGTHVAGIIAGVRDNGIGMQGVANNAKIMVLRVVPDGDERDKDVANAIRYAADNGAKIINMSFGKSYSPQKTYVDEAVWYAESKGVLMVHAAGNSSKNNDKSNNFPNSVNEITRERCKTWIEVGANSWKGEMDLPATFTNYGKMSVDVFAPGVDIYSTVPDNGYEELSGTSMAAPVVSGLAALIWSYYPDLTAEDVKNIIINSYADFGKTKVYLPKDSPKKKKTKFKKLSRTGGIVNALNAFRMASDYQKTSAQTGG